MLKQAHEAPEVWVFDKPVSETVSSVILTVKKRIAGSDQFEAIEYIYKRENGWVRRLRQINEY